MALEPRVTEVERLLFRSDNVAAGAFRCPADHPLFPDSGPASGYLVVFPRTSTTIVAESTTAVLAGPPTAVFYNCGQEYTRRKIDDIDACDWFMFDDAVVRDVVARYDPAVEGRDRRLFTTFVAPSSARTYLAQRQIYSLLSSGAEVDPLEIEERMLALFATAVGESMQRPEPRFRPSPQLTAAVETVKLKIAARPTAKTSLAKLAAATACSPFQLCRAFRAITGFTITEFRHALRLRRSLSALRRRSCDLTTLALDLGYTSHSHFTMLFRRHFGITPSAFRKAVA